MNTRLEIAHIGKISEGKYIAHIGIVNDEGGTPFKTITIDATNMEFARKIAEIRIEEMMSSKINLLKTNAKEAIIITANVIRIKCHLKSSR